MSSTSQKEYLKKYLSSDVKKKKKKKITSANIKRSVIVDDDIDLKSMRPLDDDEVDLYQMDEDAPLIAGIIDERPPELKAQEYYSSKRWKVFGGEDGVNVVDSMQNDQNDSSKDSKESNNQNYIGNKSDERENNSPKIKTDKKDKNRTLVNDILRKNYKIASSEKDSYSPEKNTKNKNSSYHDSKYSTKRDKQCDSDESPPRVEKKKPDLKYDSDVSPPRKSYRHSSSESDISPLRRTNYKTRRDSDESPPRRNYRKQSPKLSSESRERRRDKITNRNQSNSPPRRDKTKKLNCKQDRSDSDASPPRKNDKHSKYVKDIYPRREKKSYKEETDLNGSPPSRSDNYSYNRSLNRGRKGHKSDSDNSPPRKESKNSLGSRRRSSKSRSPEIKSRPFHKKYSRHYSPDAHKTSASGKNKKSNASDSDNSPPRRKIKKDESDSDFSPPRKNSQVNDRPRKKVLYKPNDDSSDEESRSNSKKMKITLDGKQAGLQDAKQLKKELSDLKMKEDNMFSKMDASVSGVGAAPVKRDRKTGQIRDLEKEKEAQKEKEAKESVVNEKYYKWGKGIKQTEDAVVRAAEIMKEMNKPLARYVDDKDLDEFLKAQDRDGDPMLEYIKKKQSESTPLQGEKPIYKGSWTPNRFNIRPGYRWDGVVRSNGYEQEWFKTKNAKKARDEEAYKWSTSDM